MRLTHCLGPMLPMSDFDDPNAVRDRFQALSNRSSGDGRFEGVPNHDLTTVRHEPGSKLSATLRVPGEARFFADHFPRRPVFPATLLLDALSGAALGLARESGHWPADQTIGIQRIANMKMRSFISPGALLEISADLAAPESGTATASLVARLDGRRVATAKAHIGCP